MLVIRAGFIMIPSVMVMMPGMTVPGRMIVRMRMAGLVSVRRSHARAAVDVRRSLAAMLDPLMQQWTESDHAGERAGQRQPDGKELPDKSFHSSKVPALDRAPQRVTRSFYPDHKQFDRFHLAAGMVCHTVR